MLTDVSKFMEVLLNDCSVPHYDSDLPPDPAEMSFLVLRVREACRVVMDPWTYFSAESCLRASVLHINVDF